ncbi:hypothetical protein C8R44DRAFT_747724 [Mycena epipterygia]|nr:hypothetical protein C8R44DRAFT_747724 [Mycena epipterygia]
MPNPAPPYTNSSTRSRIYGTWSPLTPPLAPAYECRDLLIRSRSRETPPSRLSGSTRAASASTPTDLGSRIDWTPRLTPWTPGGGSMSGPSTSDPQVPHGVGGGGWQSDSRASHHQGVAAHPPGLHPDRYQAATRAFARGGRQPDRYLLDIFHREIDTLLRAKQHLSIHIVWCLGNEGVEGNETVDGEAKKAVEGRVST